MKWTAQLVATLASAFVMACAGGGGGGEASGAPAAVGGAGWCVVDRVPLTVGDGLYPYVEPEDLFRVESGFMVVGSPTYTWAPGTDGDSLPVTRDQYVAARFTLDGRATLIERPLPDSIGSVRTLPLGGDRWGVLFDVAWATGGSTISRTRSLWYAEHDGAGWSLLESVPMPEAERFDFISSTEVVRIGDELVWVGVVRLPSGRSQVFEYRRRGGAWHYEVISGESVEVSTLGYDEHAGLWMAHYATDTTFTDFRKAVRLYRRDATGWALAHRLAVYPGATLVSHIVARVASNGVTLSWRLQDERDDSGYAVIGLDAISAGTGVDLGRRVYQVVPLGPLGAEPRWLVTRVAPDGRSFDLNLLGLGTPVGVDGLATVPSPYLAFVASLALSPSEVLIVGPEVSSDPAHPFVRSLLLRLSSSCS